MRIIDYQFININNTMGKGDQKSRKGKIAIGSFGKSRPHKLKKKAEKAEATETKPAKK